MTRAGSTRDDTSIYLVMQAQCGDRAALESLLIDLYGRLRRYIAGMVGEDDAEDALQECLFRIAHNLNLLSEPLAFHAWTYRIAHRTALLHLRREKHWRQHLHDEELLASVPAPERLCSQAIEIAQLRSLLADIPPRSRDVLVMHYIEALTLEDIAVVLGVPIGTVKSRLAYGLTVARRTLTSQGASR